ncbi:MAG: AI-2E family transporter [Rikenellaceae bacterium]|nr:AI-2E family transporter [Rikenellaceae bacterium]
MIKKVKNYNSFFRQLLFLMLLLITGYVIFDQLSFFIGSFLGAITIYIVVRNSFFRIIDNHKVRPGLVSLGYVLVVTLILAALGYLVYEITASEIPAIDTSQIIGELNNLTDKVSKFVGVRIASENLITQSGNILTKFLSSILNTTYSFAINIFLMIVILYFLLANAHKLEKKILLYQPFRGESLILVKDEFRKMIFSNAVGIPLVMISQGLAAALIYWLFGMNHVLLWAFVTALCGLLPMVGTSLVTVPLGIYMIVTGHELRGVIMIICGLFIIANVDNLTRIVLMKRVANTHPLIIIFGVLLGIPLFGFWGIIFGPLLISGFLLLIRIYYYEYRLINPCEEGDTEECAKQEKKIIDPDSDPV